MHPSSPTPLHTRRVTAKEEGPIALLMRKGVEVRVRDVTNFLGDKVSVDGGQQCGIQGWSIQGSCTATTHLPAPILRPPLLPLRSHPRKGTAVRNQGPPPPSPAPSDLPVRLH